MINWKRLVINLMKHNIGMNQAASRIGVPAGFLQPIWLGYVEEPIFSVGIKLLDLHLDVCPKQHADLGDIHE